MYDISVVEDISERRRAGERAQYLATHDEMTDLPNRAMFGQLLAHAIEHSRRYQRQFAVLCINLDRFKIITDSLGHEAGDLLKIIAPSAWPSTSHHVSSRIQPSRRHYRDTRRDRIAPHLIEFDITESMIIHDMDLAIAELSAMKTLGVRRRRSMTSARGTPHSRSPNTFPSTP